MLEDIFCTKSLHFIVSSNLDLAHIEPNYADNTQYDDFGHFDTIPQHYQIFNAYIVILWPDLIFHL
jgi:hypothetical protein